MEGETLGQSRLLIPRRSCSRCDARRDVLHLTKIGGTWLCAPCHRQISVKAPETPFARLDDDDQPDRSNQPEQQVMSVEAAIRLADNAYRFAGIAVKLGFYGLIYGMIHRYPSLLTALTGIFLADVVTWVLSSWFDLQFHRKAVLIEFVLYCAAALTLQNLGVFALPSEPGERALMGVAFSVALALKLLLEGRRIFFGTDREGW